MGNKLGGGEQGLKQGDYLGGSCDNLDDNNPDEMAWTRVAVMEVGTCVRSWIYVEVGAKGIY